MGNKRKNLYYEFERYEAFTDDEWQRITNEWTIIKEVLDFERIKYSLLHGLDDASYSDESIGITYSLSDGYREEFVIGRDGADTEGWSKDMHVEHYDEIYYSVLANPRSAAGFVIRHMLLFIENMAPGKLKIEKPLAFERSKN